MKSKIPEAQTKSLVPAEATSPISKRETTVEDDGDDYLEHLFRETNTMSLHGGGAEGREPSELELIK